MSSTAASAADLMAARTQMAVSLGWHLVIACLGWVPAAGADRRVAGRPQRRPGLAAAGRRWARPLGVLFAVGGGVGHHPLILRPLVAVRVTAALAVVAIIWGWAAAQYPYLLDPDLTIAQAAASAPSCRPCWPAWPSGRCC
jgi:hypothetical protein